jgi:hypothetical protein
MPRWSNHPWVVSVGSGLVVAILVGVAGFVFGPRMYSATPTTPAAPTTSTAPTTSPPPPASPKVQIEIKANSFELPGVNSGFLSFFPRQLELELTTKYLAEKKSISDVRKLMESMLEIKLLKNIFEVAGSNGYNSILIANKGNAADKNIVLFIDGIRFADIEGEYPNVQREKNLIKIQIIRPGDKIYLRVWTAEILPAADSDRVRASSDAGQIAVSVQ